MIQPITDLQFERMIEDAELPVLVEFWQPGCSACQALLRELDLLQQETQNQLVIYSMNVQENFQIPAELEISSLPTLALYRRGQFERFIGGIGKKQYLLEQLNLAEGDTQRHKQAEEG